MTKDETEIVNSLFRLMGLPEDKVESPERTGSPEYTVGLMHKPLVQREREFKENPEEVKRRITGMVEEKPEKIEKSESIISDVPTPYYCKSCKTYFKTIEPMAKDISVKKGFKPVCLKCRADETRERSIQKKGDSVIVDFSLMPQGLELLKAIKKEADSEFRSLPMQILYMLTKYKTGT